MMSPMPAFQTLIEPLSKSATVKSVYGEPITANGKTIIPVARIAYGFGGGSGKKRARALIDPDLAVVEGLVTRIQQARMGKQID